MSDQKRLLVQSGFDDHLDGAVTKLLQRTRNAAPLQSRIFGSLVPSTNINNGTNSDTVMIGGVPFAIDGQSKRKSGIGVMAGAEVSYRYGLGNKSALVASARAVGRTYPSIDLTSLSLDSSIGLTRLFGRTGISSSITLSANHNGSAFSDVSYGFRFELQHRFNARWSSNFSPMFRIEDNLIDNGLDGWSAGFNSHINYTISRKHYVRVLANLNVRGAEVERFRYTDVELGVGYNTPLPFNIEAYAQVNAAMRRYDGLYPGLNESQKDFRWGGRLSLTKTDIRVAGLAPRIEYKFERLQSNAAFADRTTHGFDIRLTKSF